ncbi:MAG: hypothetical protein R8M38_06490 [Mariprofundaceae bacterium]
MRLFIKVFVGFLCALIFSSCSGGGSGIESAVLDPVQTPDVPIPTEPNLIGKPSQLPTLQSLNLYAPSSPINQKIAADAILDEKSADFVSLIVEAAAEGGFLIELKQYSAPVYFANANTPRFDVNIACGSQWGGGITTLKGVPIPSFAEPAQDIDGASNPIVEGVCGEDADQDNQMIILDPITRCEYDLFQARSEQGEWVASWANSISMDSTGIYEQGFSSRGSGFTTLAGLIWPDELQSGQINHALSLTYPFAKAGGPVSPASESDGISTHPFALPEGARIRLDPTLDLSTLSLSGAEMAIARALQEYGMFVVDDGTLGVSIEAVDPRSAEGNPYQGIFDEEEEFPFLSNIPLDRLQVLALPPQNPNYNENNALVSSGCAEFE